MFDPCLDFWSFHRKFLYYRHQNQVFLWHFLKQIQGQASSSPSQRRQLWPSWALQYQAPIYPMNMEVLFQTSNLSKKNICDLNDATSMLIDATSQLIFCRVYQHRPNQRFQAYLSYPVQSSCLIDAWCDKTWSECYYFCERCLTSALISFIKQLYQIILIFSASLSNLSIYLQSFIWLFHLGQLGCQQQSLKFSEGGLIKNRSNKQEKQDIFSFYKLSKLIICNRFLRLISHQFMQGQQSTPFYSQNHIQYLLALDDSKDLYSIGKYLTEHLKVAGGYWSLTGLAALKHKLSEQKIKQLIAWLKSCQNEDGGFGGNFGHDSHILSTHYAVLILIGFGKLAEINTDRVIEYVSKLQKDDGSFMGDKWGEVDTRFSYCGVSCLDLLNALNKINIPKAAEYVLKCRNFDGSFGGIPDAESHAAYVFCCVGTLQIIGYGDSYDKELLAKWLCERQTSKGGFNGRPEKLPDLCYSWWIYSTLCMIQKEEWIDQKKLEEYCINCQDSQGGISERPGNVRDVFHTFFGLAALSLLNPEKYHLEPIDPTYAVTKIALAELKKENKAN